MKYLTTKQCAELIGVTDSWVRYLIIRGKLPATKLGRDWIVKEQDLEKFKAVPRKVGRPKSKTAS